MYHGKFTKRALRQANKSRPKMGTIVFYSIYGAFVAIFIAAILVATSFLKDWLIRYEASQPEHKAQQVFDDLFAVPDWENLYELAGVQDTPYEGKDHFAAYMNHKVGTTALTCEETAAGLSGDHKYIVKLGEEKIEDLTVETGKIAMNVPAKKIVTIELV